MDRERVANGRERLSSWRTVYRGRATNARGECANCQAEPHSRRPSFKAQSRVGSCETVRGGIGASPSPRLEESAPAIHREPAGTNCSYFCLIVPCDVQLEPRAARKKKWKMEIFQQQRTCNSYM